MPQKSDKPRVAVFAYSDVGHACLRQLIAADCNIVAVFTHEDKPSEDIWFPSVAELAKANGIKVYTPEKLKRSEWESRFRNTIKPELILSFYYRNMIASWLLEIPRLGAYNMHGSYLPTYRGRAPVNWAVLNGEHYTGATLHVMVKQADAGDIVDQERVAIEPDEAAITVMEHVRDAAVAVLARQIDKLQAGTVALTPQDETQASYFGGRKPEDGRIDWTQPVRKIYDLVRAVSKPYPGAFSDTVREGKRLIIWWAQPLEDDEARAVAVQYQPGDVVSEAPLRIACRDGLLEVTDSE